MSTMAGAARRRSDIASRTERKNLELCENRVSRILFDGNRAIGVEIERDGQSSASGAARVTFPVARSFSCCCSLRASPGRRTGQLVSLNSTSRSARFAGPVSVEFHVQDTRPYVDEAVMSPAKAVKLALEWCSGSGQLSVARTKRRVCQIRPSERCRSQYQCLNFRRRFQDRLHRWRIYFIVSVCRRRAVVK